MKKHFARGLALLLALTLALTLTACGGGAAQSGSSSSASQEAPTVQTGSSQESSEEASSEDASSEEASSEAESSAQESSAPSTPAPAPKISIGGVEQNASSEEESSEEPASSSTGPVVTIGGGGTTNGKYANMEAALADPDVVAALDTSALEEQGMTCVTTAEGNKLTMEVSFTQELWDSLVDAAGSDELAFSTVAETLEASTEETAADMETVVADIQLSIEEPGVSMEVIYKTPDGREIFSRVFTAPTGTAA